MSYKKAGLGELATNLEKALSDFKTKSDKAHTPRAEDAFDILSLFDHSVGNLFLLRNDKSESISNRNFTDSVISSTHDILSFKENTEKKEGGYSKWVNEYRKTWRRNHEIFIFCLILFIVSSMVGFSIGSQDPSLVTVLVPQYLMEMILDKEAWFQRLQENPLMGGLGIAINNIRVSINSFILGALLGIGGIILLCFNGLLFGAIFGFCVTHGFDKELFDFVAAHGVLELSIIIASTFSGLLIGRVFYLRPYKNFSERMRIAAREAGIIAAGVIPWLIIAAFFEGFVSPFNYFDTNLKLIIGLSLGLIFIYWTFKPVKKY
ncbi:MAG TPA: stage II sporulation protein M [Oligoflexia bacterium]|nr:stage II sporulation protein M [Oligoflexia bacterium]HMP47111.1 stage II sporulation protein M [Oligoflexia bacterium]